MGEAVDKNVRQKTWWIFNTTSLLDIVMVLVLRISLLLYLCLVMLSINRVAGFLHTRRSVRKFCNPFRMSTAAASCPNILSAKIQAVDYTSLILSVEELARSEDIVPSKVENVVQVDENNLAIVVKGLTNEPVWLQFCWSASAARVGLAYPVSSDVLHAWTLSSSVQSSGLAYHLFHSLHRTLQL